MSINLDLDFQDYAPTTSGTTSTNKSSQSTSSQNPNTDQIQVRIPSSKESSSNVKQNLQGSKSFLNLLQNFQSGGQIPGGLSEETIQELLWLSGKQKNRQQRSSIAASSSWGLGYFAQYFDVTTEDVLQRVVWSAIPIRKPGIDLEELTDQELTIPLASSGDDSGNLIDRLGTKQKHYSYVERFIQSRPDLYGPFWVSATLIFAVGIFSNIASFKSHRLKYNQVSDKDVNNHTSDNMFIEKINSMEEWHYSVDELNMTASLVMFYVTLLPTFVWFLFWFRGCTKYYTLTETVCAYGYSLSIYIVLAALLMIQAIVFRYIVVIIASVMSGLVLIMSFLPIVKSDPNRGGSHITLVIVFASQLGLAYILHRIMLQ